MASLEKKKVYLFAMVYSVVCFLSEQIMNLLATALENPERPIEEDTEQKVALLGFRAQLWGLPEVLLMCCFQTALQKSSKFKAFACFLPSWWPGQEAARAICAASVVHQADQACRRVISQAMQDAKGTSSPCPTYPGC